MGIRRIDYDLCNGCGTCVNYCPLDVLRMDKKKKKAYIKYIRDCQGCFLCEMECPKQAICCVPTFEFGITRAW